MDFILTLVGLVVVCFIASAMFFREHPFFTLFGNVAAVFGFLKFHEIAFGSIIQFLWIHSIEIGLISVAYIIIGAVIGVLKWLGYWKKSAKALQKQINAFEKENDVTGLSEEQREEGWASFYSSHTGKDYKKAVPELTDNKALFFGWTIAWPFTAFEYFFSDILKDFFEKIFDAAVAYVNKFKGRYFVGMEEYTKYSK